MLPLRALGIYVAVVFLGGALLGATSLREIGLARPLAHWRRLLGGLFLGFASLALVASGAVALLAGTISRLRIFTADVPGGNTWFWGTGKLIDGWLVFLMLSLTLVVFTRAPLRRKTNSVT